MFKHLQQQYKYKRGLKMAKVKVKTLLLDTAEFASLKAAVGFASHSEDDWADAGDISSIPIADVISYGAQGGEIEDYPAFIEMTPTKYAEDVLSGIPNRTVTDEEGVTTTIKWNEWKDSTHTHYEFSGTHYVPGNSYGVELTDTELAVIDGVAGYILRTQAEMKAILVANAPGGE